MAAAPPARPVALAVLDDPHNTAAPHFARFHPAQLALTVFRDTLPPYAHPASTERDRAALIARLRPFSVLATMRERTAFPRELLRQLPALKLILATGSKFESWDLAAMRELGIQVCAAPGKARASGPAGHPTTQHVWALILALARNVAADDALIKGKSGPAGWQTGLAIGLQGKTLGVVGFGRLGAQVARIGALAFGMKIACWSANLTQEKADQLAEEAGLPVTGGGAAAEGQKTFRAVSKEALFRDSDVLSLHYVLSERSRGIVGSQEFAWMKPSALFVNAARGPLVDETALLDTLRNGRIRGAAIDVFDIEPLPADSPWRTEDWDAEGKSRVLLTPHMGYVDEDTMSIWYEETAENVERWLSGKELLHRVV